MSIDISYKPDFRESDSLTSASARRKVYFHPYHSVLILRCNLSAHLFGQYFSDREPEAGRFGRGGFHGIEAVKETACFDLVKPGCMVGKSNLPVFT